MVQTCTAAPPCLNGALVEVTVKSPNDIKTTQTGLAQASIDLPKLLQGLKEAFDHEKALGIKIDKDQEPASAQRLRTRVQELLKEYSLHNSDDWRNYAFFNDMHYVRNLVEGNEDFELLVLCWRTSQHARVHNHGNSHCWLTPLDGCIQEAQYTTTLPGNPTALGSGAGTHVEVQKTKVTDLQLGDVGYINDDICLHTVGCTSTASSKALAEGAPAPMGGVTLHLYAPPIRRVKIFEGSTITERTPGFYSVGGVRT